MLLCESAKENDVKLRVRYIVICMCLVGLAAGYAWAKVNFDYDKKADFSGYSTYAFLERDNSIETQLPDHLRIRMQRVTEEVLAEKGFSPAPAPPPPPSRRWPKRSLLKNPSLCSRSAT